MDSNKEFHVIRIKKALASAFFNNHLIKDFLPLVVIKEGVPFFLLNSH